MYQKIFDRKVSMPIINGLLALMMIFGTFAAANAQAEGTRIMLPIMQTGASGEQPLSGPFAEVSDLLADMDIDVGAAVDVSEIEDLTNRVQAAGSCYWGHGSGRTLQQHSNGGFLFTLTNKPNTSACRDLNLYIEVRKPHANGCHTNVLTFANNELKFMEDAPKNRWFEPVEDLHTNWDALIWVPSECNLSRVFWAS